MVALFTLWHRWLEGPIGYNWTQHHAIWCHDIWFHAMTHCDTLREAVLNRTENTCVDSLYVFCCLLLIRGSFIMLPMQLVHSGSSLLEIIVAYIVAWCSMRTQQKESNCNSCHGKALRPCMHLHARWCALLFVRRAQEQLLAAGHCRIWAQKIVDVQSAWAHTFHMKFADSATAPH